MQLEAGVAHATTRGALADATGNLQRLLSVLAAVMAHGTGVARHCRRLLAGRDRKVTSRCGAGRRMWCVLSAIPSRLFVHFQAAAAEKAEAEEDAGEDAEAAGDDDDAAAPAGAASGWALVGRLRFDRL